MVHVCHPSKAMTNTLFPLPSVWSGWPAWLSFCHSSSLSVLPDSGPSPQIIVVCCAALEDTKVPPTVVKKNHSSLDSSFLFSGKKKNMGVLFWVMVLTDEGVIFCFHFFPDLISISNILCHRVLWFHYVHPASLINKIRDLHDLTVAMLHQQRKRPPSHRSPGPKPNTFHAYCIRTHIISEIPRIKAI